MPAYHPKTIEAIYEDYQGRREALLRGLIDDCAEFYEQCDPSRDNLCLYGHPDGTWSVDTPVEEVPPELPEPVLGINFARDGMDRKDWLALCAVHSDAWLMAVLFFYAARYDDVGRAELFSLVNQHPTVYEVVTGRCSRSKMSKRKVVIGRTQQQALAHAASAPAVPAYVPKFLPHQQASADEPLASGRLLTYADITHALSGRQAELFWPDDGKWYLVEIESVDLPTRTAKVHYATGENETLNLEECVQDGHMSLIF